MGRTGTQDHFHKRTLALAGAIVLGSLSSPALAESEPRTKLIRCGDESCLRVTGHRDDPAAIVLINGHAVAVEGKRKWKAYLPVETVRAWSARNARTIEVALAGPETAPASAVTVDLPIGLLAKEINLASLVVSVR